MASVRMIAPRIAAACVAAAIAIGGVVAQRVEPLTAARVRALARDAAAAGQDDSSAVVLALDERVRARFGDFESFPLSIVRSEALTVFLASPFMNYRRALIEHLRMREPLAGIPWVDAVVISVNPDRVDAPDITSVIVTRDGRAVPPVKNLLKPMTFFNGAGEKAVIHAGELHFPTSAFAPGAAVTVTAMPASGDAMSISLDDAQLRALK